MIRLIVRYLMSHPQLVETLANSYPFRRAAQVTASLYFKAKGFGSDYSQALTREMEKRFPQSPTTPTPPGVSTQSPSHPDHLNIHDIEQKLRKLKDYTEQLKRKQGR